MSRPSRHVRWPGILVGGLGLVLLALSCVVASDLATTSRSLQDEVVRTEGLVLSNVRTLGQTQRELLRLQHLLDIDAPDDEVRLQAGFVSQRTQESALSYQQVTLGADSLMATARRNEAAWREEVLPALNGLLLDRRDSARTRAQIEERIQGLERSYNVLASLGETNRREQVATTNETATDLSGDLRRLLLMLGVLLAAALASSATGAVLFLRADRRRSDAVRELRSLNDDLAFYSRVVEATDSPLIASDPTGRITWVNEAFTRSTGWRLEEVRDRRPGEFLLGPATDRPTVRRLLGAMENREPVRVEIAIYTHDGEQRWVTTDVSPLLGADGELEGFFAVQTDITERHEAELLLVEARRAAEETARQKASFLATMSHEIRTPLNAVLGLTDLLLLTDLDGEQRDYVETAHRSGSHLLALINDVLVYSSLESGRLEHAEEPFSMAGVLGETVAMFGPEAEVKGVALRLHLAPDVPAALRGDEVRLRQVLVNLVGNALKFTESGSVSVETTVVRRSEDADGRPVCELLTTVTDTGIGIPGWRIPDLFQSFVRGDASTTREYGGTGLGLAISRGLVEAMGGTIELESELGRGTRVSVRTAHRAIGAPESDPAALVAAEPDDSCQLSVLVAEDDAVNRKVVVGMLARLGIVPSVVGNGRDAVDLVERVDFDVVLMDVEMPVMDGVSAVRRIRDSQGERRPHVIALTANALTGDRERFIEAGMDDYVSKPVTLESLTAALVRARPRSSV
ncbi:hybrid sensor histidine kinase/response regulator [Nocardioides lianchengensis]|uniref:hybrid sensor histidine kinase/response regulator n=1 Tax=Nocardioides lianchengensis TaxID=1045774 RepID=UPI001113C940|nr:ATP-binding protein [Nocardioides lianchengensis]NYG09342.1 hypothetical protein [Nocardioides lianchengensis]